MSLGVLGKYRLDHRLGGGGMAEVFLASTIGAEGFERRVAIKRVLPGYSDNPAFAQMFVSEAQISSAIVHPNIVSVLDFDRDAENRLFLVMELVDGKDLDALVATGPLPIPVVIFVIGEVLRGLGYAHDLPASGSGVRGIVHRDVSPHNVLLSWEGAVKVSDFGIAKARAASEATASVFIKGKPAYMSPEQANGQALDGRSDLFAVGIMLWEMLVGRRLFVGNDVRATLAAVLFGQIPRPRSLRPEIGKDLDRVVMKLLERDLHARYPSGEAALEDLMNCVDAPRSGREALIAAMAERFPTERPVRQSHSRSRSAGGNAASGISHLDPQARTLSAAEASAQVQSVGAAMGAATGTLQARGPNRALMAAIVVGVAAIGGIAAFVAVRAMRSHGASVGSDAAVDARAPDAAIARDAVAIDAVAPPVELDAAPAAAPLDAPARHGGDHHHDAPPVPTPDAPPAATPVRPAGTGTLTVRSDPPVSVSVDGSPLGDTPIVGYKLAAGPHELAMENTDANIHDRRKIVITENKPLVVQR